MLKRITAVLFTLAVFFLTSAFAVIAEDNKQATISISDLKANNIADTSVDLSWSVQRNNSDTALKGNEKIIVLVNGKQKNISINYSAEKKRYDCKITELVPSTAYSLTIQETTSDAESTVNFTTGAVGNVKGFKSFSSYNSVVLKWKKVKNADGYKITWINGKKKGTFNIKKGSTVKKVVKLPKELRNKTIKYSIVAYKTGKGESKTPAKCTGEAVKNLQFNITFSTTRVLTSHSGGKKKTTFAKGTKVRATGYNGGRYVFSYKGRTYMVKRISITNAKVIKSQLNSERTYSKTEAESFVNSLGVTSRTKSLIWVNTYTQKLYYFKGSKGKWKLVKGPWAVSTGKAKTPTPTGKTTVKSKSRGCTEAFPQTPWWCVCSEFSIHGKAPYYPDMGAPASNGCVRNWTKNAKWMYENVPIGTTVYIF